MEYEIVSPEIKRVDDKFIPIDNIDILNVYITLKNNGLNVETLRDNVKTLTRENRADADGDSAYDFINNVILCPDDHYKNSITHELLHASTRIIDGDGAHMGLMNGDWLSQDIIGIGLNEGMTAYLDLKFFGDYTKEKRLIEQYVYPLTKKIIEHLRLIIPESDLIEYYMNSDLAGFMTYLMKFYDDPDYILDFIGAIDYLYIKFDMPVTVDDADIEGIKENYNFVKTFLAESVYIIANRYYENNMITKKDLKEFKKVSISLLKGILELGGKNYGESNIHEYNKIKKRYVVRKHTGEKTHA